MEVAGCLWQGFALLEPHRRGDQEGMAQRGACQGPPTPAAKWEVSLAPRLMARAFC